MFIQSQRASLILDFPGGGKWREAKFSPFPNFLEILSHFSIFFIENTSPGAALRENIRMLFPLRSSGSVLPPVRLPLFGEKNRKLSSRCRSLWPYWRHIERASRTGPQAPEILEKQYLVNHCRIHTARGASGRLFRRNSILPDPVFHGTKHRHPAWITLRAA